MQMYFSTNSRYVLHRAQWMTPSAYLLKGAERLFSVKFPNDDPSKPALRVNIPKDSSGTDKRTKLIHNKNFAEPRSRSLVSRTKSSSLNPTVRDNFLPKSESESQLPLLEVENMTEIDQTNESAAADRDAETYLTRSDPTTSGQQNHKAAARNEDDYAEGLKTPLNDPATGEALADSSAALNSAAVGDQTSPDAAQPEASARSHNQERSDPRMLYIIVDSPERTEEPKQYKNLASEGKANLPQEPLATVKELKPAKPSQAKSGRQKPESWWSKKSKSLSKLPVFKNDERHSFRRMDVQEVEDVATYVNHSRQKQNKSYGLECVPEKEFTTRSGSSNYSEVPIKLPTGGFSKNFRGLPGEMTPVEELPEFVKHTEKKRSKFRTGDPWNQKGERSRTTWKSSHSAPFPTQAVVDSSNLRDSWEHQHPKVSGDERRKRLGAVPKESSGAGKSVVKAAAVETPERVSEAKPEVSAPKEPAAPVAETAAEKEHEAEMGASYSFPAGEEKPEYNLTKVESEPISIQLSQNEYYSPWKDNSSNYPDAPQVSVDNSKAVPPPKTPTKTVPQRKLYQSAKKSGKYADSEDPTQKIDDPKTPGQAKTEKTESDGTDFQPSSGFVSIGCDKIPVPPVKFSAAFPPLLCEALKIRGRILGFRREFLFSDKWMGKLECLGKHLDAGSKPPQKDKKMDLSENSILFPKAETEKFDCPLFGKKEEMPLKAGKEPKPERTVKIGDNMANVANEGLTETKGQPSVDSLDMMKKVKKIVELELDNAVKIFRKVDPRPETSSVVMLEEEDKWRVDTEALEKCVKLGKEIPAAFGSRRSVENNILGDRQNNLKIQDLPSKVPMFLPPKKESDCQMKLCEETSSVVTFNPQTNEFFVDKEALAEAIRRRTGAFFDDVVIQTLKGRLRKGAKNESMVVFNATKDRLTYALRGGDSILVFDEETQTWKVDYSILEKREEQHRMEEELMKRSELILETFEKLERGQMSKIPTPATKEKKIFDYGKEEWKSYPTEKKSTEKPSKAKYPFKESNAEEIRRSNSDLYENLFVGNKKDTKMNKNSNSSQSEKGSKSCCSMGKKLASGSGSKKASGTPRDPDSSKPESQLPPAGEGKGEDKEPTKEDDSFWESFLKMNILPRDISEIRTPQPPPPPAPPKSQPPKPSPLEAPKIESPKPSVPTPKVEDPNPGVPPTKIEDPKPNVPPKKIEEPRFRVYIPFIGDKKPETTKVKDPPKETPKVEDPKKKPPGPPPSMGGVSKEEGAVKTPPKGVQKVEDPQRKPPQPTVGSVSKQDAKIKTPAKEPPKVEDPKKKPSEPALGGVTKDTAKKSPKIEDPKNKPSEPALGGTVKEDPKIKAPAKEEPKVEDPKKKSHEPTMADLIVEDTGIKAPPKEAPKVEDPKKKPPEAPPTAAGDTKSKPPQAISGQEDPRKSKPPPTIGASNSPLKGETVPPSSSPSAKVQDPKSSMGGKKDKSAADHYISENIVEISRNTSKELPTKFKTNKIETVKVNISSEKRMPSKVTEINLNKKCDEKGKESNTALKKPQNANDPKKPADVTSKIDKCTVENKSFYKNFEKYKTPFSDPEYEEKSMKIKSDIESNPNLKKLDNWNKTLVLHDIGKPPENIEGWLKDETDKMATLLLKVLQEAADGKPRKKQPLVKCKSGDKPLPKGTPFDNASKKCETTPESFLFRVRTVNLSLENDKKLKPAEDRKPHPKPTPKDAAAQMEKAETPYKVVDATKTFSSKEAPQLSVPAPVKNDRVPTCAEVQKSRMSQTALESVEPAAAMSKDLTYQNIFPMEITEEVPGPEFLKRLSNAWKLFPIIGSQMTIVTLLRAYHLVNLKNSFFGNGNPAKSRTNAFAKLFTKYGPIVNVQGPLSGNVILIHKAEHFVSVFEQDAFMTVRSVFDSLEQSRREAEDKMQSAVICTDWSKPEWNELRKGTNDPILKGCEKFLDSVEVAGDSLISSIRKSRNLQNYVSEDFIDEIKRWSLEGICGVLFEKSFGFLDRKNTNMSWIMEPDKLFMAIEEATNYLNKCEKGFQTWRLMTTGSSVGLGQAYRSLTAILTKQLYQAEINLKSKNEFIKEQSPFMSEDLTFLEGMLLNDGLTTEDITCNLIDIMLIGTNVMTSAMGFLLYNLAQNGRVQNKLLKELKRALPDKNSRLDYQSLHSLKYLQACLKESLRLHIPIPLFSRMLQNDILLSNYIIPKGSYVVMDYRVSCMKEQIFDDPEKFMPERWLTEEKWMKDKHPFDTFPMCQGPRAELARQVVDLQLSACVAKVVRNFEIEYHYGEINGESSGLISLPGKPLKLNFIERNS